MISNQRGSTAPDAPGYGVTWGGVPFHARRAMTVAAATLVVAGLAGPTAASAATTTSASSADQVSVIVRELDGAGNAPERAVVGIRRLRRASARHHRRLHRQVPSDRLDALRAVPGVAVGHRGRRARSAEHRRRVAGGPGRLALHAGQQGHRRLGDVGRGLHRQGRRRRASSTRASSRSTGSRQPGKVVYGPDLTLENGTPAKNLDTYGHGTHMAGIIAGRDAAADTVSGNSADFVGMAPDSRIVSIKVADAKGQTDVSQAIAAIDWVVQNRNKNGLNIRVLNMSFGTDGVQGYLLDPLAYAAEQAWHKGIVVVVAVGNEGFGTAQGQQPGLRPVPDRRRQRQRQRHGHHGRRRHLLVLERR